MVQYLQYPSPNAGVRFQEKAGVGETAVDEVVLLISGWWFSRNPEIPLLSILTKISPSSLDNYYFLVNYITVAPIVSYKLYHMCKKK